MNKLMWTVDNYGELYVDGNLWDTLTYTWAIKETTLPEVFSNLEVKASNHGGPAGFIGVLDLDGKIYPTNSNWDATSDLGSKKAFEIPDDFDPWSQYAGYLFAENLKKLGAKWIWWDEDSAMWDAPPKIVVFTTRMKEEAVAQPSQKVIAGIAIATVVSAAGIIALATSRRRGK